MSNHGEIESDSDITQVLFHTKSSRAAGKVLLLWFRSRGGRASKEELADFAVELAAGRFPFKLSRSNFYATVLRKLADAGLVALQPEFDHESKKVIRTYRAIMQPISKRRPPSPSLLYNAHIFAEKWNAQFADAG